MGYKSRSNYKCCCMKFDCINRNVVCDECLNGSLYLKDIQDESFDLSIHDEDSYEKVEK
jgi:hypothetical protein